MADDELQAARAGRALLLTGTVGSGKTTAAEATSTRLQERGVRHAVIDLDALRRCWPAPADDPFNAALALRNLRSVARAYREAGATHLVLAGVLEAASARAAHEDALGVPLVVGRLQVDLDVVRARLARRHEHDDAGLRWHLDRSGELDAVLRSARPEDFTVEATALTPPEVAGAVLAAAGWDEAAAAP